MEDCEKIFCSLCLDTTSDNNFTVIDGTIREVFNVLLLNQDLKENSSVMCNTCRTKVFEAFRFKAKCIDTEDCIFPYVNSKKGVPVDLVEIYLKERGKEHLRNVLDVEKICRLCMQIYAHGFTLVKDLESDLTCKYIPEVNFSSTKKPVVCTACLDSLNTHRRFLKNCSVERDEKGPFCIEPEEIEIKSEEDENENTPDSDVELCSGKTSRNHQVTNITVPVHHYPSVKNIPAVKIYKCYSCSYKTKYRRNLVRHQVVHRGISEMQMYKCAKCSFETKHKDYLVIHQLVHKDNSEVQMYKCDTCEYETKHKRYIAIHQLKHKDACDMQMYKCDECDYETKFKKRFSRHRLVHSSKAYTCDTCSYVTKFEKYLIQHQRKHEEAQMYKCDKCKFETRHKYNLKVHQRRHKDLSEVEIYKCDVCNYQTIWKNTLKRHGLGHKKITKVETC